MQGLPREALLERPAPDSWCMLEVLCHLLHEERHDFRPRLEATLYWPDAPWPDGDWAGWMPYYHEGPPNLEETLGAGESERQSSLAWLRGLAAPDWDAVHQASWGPSARATCWRPGPPTISCISVSWCAYATGGWLPSPLPMGHATRTSGSQWAGCPPWA